MTRFQWFVIIVLIVLAGSLTTLTLFQFRVLRDITELKMAQLATAKPVPAGVAPDFSEAIASQAAVLTDLEARLESLEKDQVAKPKTANSTASAFQKQVIYLGSVSTNKTAWTDTGLEVMLNTADYPSNVNVIFEAGLSIVGGEAGARLVNKTTGAIITASEISHGSNTVTWKTSASFKLHSGNNAYAVQIRSTSSELANVTGSRLVISQ